MKLKLLCFWLVLVTIIIIGCGDVKTTNPTNNNNNTDTTATLADHQIVANFDNIPASYIDSVKSNFKILYGHTSHGSQLMSGMRMLGDTYDIDPITTEPSDDLGHNGDITWVTVTRQYLDSKSDYNIVIWSWCGGVSDNTEAGIDIYLNAINQLEIDYPNIKFVYMTGHLDGSGDGGNLRIRNNQIREYCNTNKKILFDFADIESWDPDGNYYADEGDACSWCSDWCAEHTCLDCDHCAHSHCFNCYLKGKAFWWMLARMSGWNG